MFLKQIRALFRRKGPRTVPFEQAAREFFRLGREAGRTAQPPVVYRQFCERHTESRLQEIQHGVFVCPVCRMQVAPPLVVAPIDGREPRTDQVQQIQWPLPPGSMLHDWLSEHHAAGPETQRFRTVHLGKESRR